MVKMRRDFEGLSLFSTNFLTFLGLKRQKFELNVFEKNIPTFKRTSPPIYVDPAGTTHVNRFHMIPTWNKKDGLEHAIQLLPIGMQKNESHNSLND